MRRDSTPRTSTTAADSNAGEPPSKPGPKRRRLVAAEAREAILAAAEGLLVDVGPDALRLTEVATRAGVSHPNVLYHFGSVAELQAQLAQRVAVRLATEVAAAFDSGIKDGMPIECAVESVFRVFDGGGYARLVAWLELSRNKPAWDALGGKLALLTGLIKAHPAFDGDANEPLRRRVVPVIELVIVAAIGYGLSGRTVSELFAPDERRPSVARVLSELISSQT
jgi:AcrR family transcriptional regulator